MKPPPTSPTSFLPGGPGLRPEPQRARVVDVGRGALPRSVPVEPKRTHQTEALVTVRLPNAIELNAEAFRCLPIRKGSPVDLIPPRRGASGQWLLDTRPTATGRLRQGASGRIWFTTAVNIDPNYFRQVGAPPRSRRGFTLGAEQQARVCITIPATEYSAAREVCEWQGTGVYELLPA